MENKINVAYSLANGNWQNCYISIKSLLENTQHHVDIYLMQLGIKDEILNYFKDLSEQYKNTCTITFVVVSKKMISNLLYKGASNITSWFRFLFPQLCPNVDKVIFMTGFPSIITDDLFELFNINLNNHCIACAKNVLSLKDDFEFSIIVFDCKKYRNLSYCNIFNELLKNRELILKDYNDCFKTMFKNDVQEINPKYNYVSIWHTKIFNKNISKTKEYKNAKENPIIINYLGLAPQFITCYHPYKKLWLQFASEVPFAIEEMNLYKLAATSAENSFNYFWLLSRIYPYIKPYWFRILLGFLLSIPMGLLDGITAFALKPYMDYVVAAKDFVLDWQFIHITITSLQMAFIIPIAVVAFAVIQGLMRYLEGYISAWNSAHITISVKFDLFHRLVHMHPQFFDDNSSGIVISRYMGDPESASSGVIATIQDITTASCGALGLIAVMLYSSWKLAFIGVLILCIAFLPVALVRNRIKETSNKGMVIGSMITTNINETYSGNKVMAAYELQDRQENNFYTNVWKGYNLGMSLYKRTGWMSPMMYLIASFGIAAVLGYGTHLITTNQMTAGSFASFVTSLLLLYKPVKTLGNTFTGCQGTFVAMSRIFELFDLEPAIKDCENPKELKTFDNEVKFENVKFEYIPNKLVLQNINLTVRKNETLAIVGNSGGGKSTLVNLLPRFYDIKSGSIKFDNIDIREFSLKSLRKNISMVFQDNFLYTGTIKENIMMGNPDATVEELMAAIKSAHLEEMISELPEGLETELGERGLTLSGGQRQRVAIARAMLRNAPIVILDEATSALDNESESIVQKAMDNLMQNRTVFIIAHRLSTIKNADRIAVINEGELVELGTHEELIKIDGGQYQHLYEMQFRNQENAK